MYCLDVLFICGVKVQEKGFLEACTFGGFNLIIIDLLKGLRVPNVLSPPNIIHAWNDNKRKNIDALFKFLFTYLTNDDGPLFLFVYEKKNIGDDVRIFANSNDFVVGTIFGFQIIVIVFLN